MLTFFNANIGRFITDGLMATAAANTAIVKRQLASIFNTR
jgi:hypothetical protein